MQTEIRIQETDAGAMFNIYDGDGRLIARSVLYKNGAGAREAAGDLVKALRDSVTIKGGPSFEAAKATLIFDNKGRPNSTARGQE